MRVRKWGFSILLKDITDPAAREGDRTGAAARNRLREAALRLRTWLFVPEASLRDPAGRTLSRPRAGPHELAEIHEVDRTISEAQGEAFRELLRSEILHRKARPTAAGASEDVHVV
jgi:hypothetical protein